MQPRAIHIVAGLDPVYGGPSYSVPRLCEALADRGAAATLLSVEGSRRTPHRAVVRAYEDKNFPQDYACIPGIRGLRLSSGLSKALRNAGPGADVIHNHGLWLIPNIYAGWEAARSGKPLVVSPRGMLSPNALSFSRLKKKLFWHLLQRKVVAEAACIHATGSGEYEDVRALGLVNPVAVIPNGVDIPEISEDMNTFNPSERILLALGRIHPKKGFDRLLRAWAKVESAYPTWRLRIVGPAELGHEKALRALANSLGLQRVTIEDPIHGDAKNAAYREADLFVLPSLNENFGLTVAESLASGTPVISSKGAPWSGLEIEGCGWWIDHGVASLTAALTRAMETPSERLNAMGAKGRAWMRRDFSWDRVAVEMLGVYEWLITGGTKPSTVRLD
jgi:glycosyltransferase involved in cell wall biosynthesis